ncbi:glutamate decarboxylase [Saccharopolyspora cebuensis]
MRAPSPAGRVSGSSPDEHQSTIPELGVDAAKAAELVGARLSQDVSPDRNLATFLTTSYEPEAAQLFGDYLRYNLVDREQYPAIELMEQQCIRMLGALWGEDPGRVVGSATTGSSEAALMAGVSLLRHWETRRGSGGRRPSLVMGANAHVCWHKFCRYWGVEPRVAPALPGRLGLDAPTARELCDETTIGVIGILGSTLDGSYEPVAAIAGALDELEAERGVDVPLHVDAASGGFVAPFLDPELLWDFRLARVRSINASGHKYGLVPPGLGWVLWRDHETRSGKLTFRVNYLGSQHSHEELTFSRSAAPVVLQYYNFVRFGFQGFRSVHARSRAVAVHLAGQLRETGRFELLGDGSELPVIALAAHSDVKLRQLSTYLADLGWAVPVYELPPDLEDVEVLRIVVRNDMTAAAADAFADAVRDYLSTSTK